MTTRLRKLALVGLAAGLTLPIARPAAAGAFGPTPSGGGKRASSDTGCFGASSARGGKAKAAAVVGAAVAGAVGAPLLARALPTAGANSSLVTQLAVNTIQSMAWQGYANLLLTLSGSSPSPLFVQVAPASFATLSNGSPFGLHGSGNASVANPFVLDLTNLAKTSSRPQVPLL